MGNISFLILLKYFGVGATFKVAPDVSFLCILGDICVILEEETSGSTQES